MADRVEDGDDFYKDGGCGAEGSVDDSRFFKSLFLLGMWEDENKKSAFWLLFSCLPALWKSPATMLCRLLRMACSCASLSAGQSRSRAFTICTSLSLLKTPCSAKIILVLYRSGLFCAVPEALRHTPLNHRTTSSSPYAWRQKHLLSRERVNTFQSVAQQIGFSTLPSKRPIATIWGHQYGNRL